MLFPARKNTVSFKGIIIEHLSLINYYKNIATYTSGSGGALGAPLTAADL